MSLLSLLTTRCSSVLWLCFFLGCIIIPRRDCWDGVRLCILKFCTENSVAVLLRKNLIEFGVNFICAE
jgi:hypothetical protein